MEDATAAVKVEVVVEAYRLKAWLAMVGRYEGALIAQAAIKQSCSKGVGTLTDLLCFLGTRYSGRGKVEDRCK